MKRLALQYAFLSPYLFIILYLIIGFITPEYSHISHTISRLSLGKYGYIESLNILQFSIGLFIAIHAVRHQSKNSPTIKEVSTMLRVIAITLTLLAIFPTDPIDTFPKSIAILSWNSVVHFFLVISFVLYAPLAIYRLYHAFLEDRDYSNLARVTVLCGGTTFVLSITWFLFFYFGILNDYRGLFQKIIALIVIYWVTKILKKITTLIPHYVIA